MVYPSFDTVCLLDKSNKQVRYYEKNGVEFSLDTAEYPLCKLVDEILVGLQKIREKYKVETVELIDLPPDINMFKRICTSKNFVHYYNRKQKFIKVNPRTFKGDKVLSCY